MPLAMSLGNAQVDWFWIAFAVVMETELEGE